MDPSYAPLLSIFQSKGKKIECEPNTLMSLQKTQGKDLLWMIESGAVNLFAIELKETRAEGVRTFLANCTSPSLLFSIDQEHTFPVLEVFAISETPTQLWVLDSDVLEEALEENWSLEPLFASLLENWIHKIVAYLEKADREKHDIFIECDTLTSVAKGATVSVKRAVDLSHKKGVVWVQLLEGEATFVGDEAHALDPHSPPFPLTYHLWIKAKTPLSIRSIATLDMMGKQQWHPALQLLHKTLFCYYLTYRQEKKEQLVRGLQGKQEEEEETLNSIFKEMVSLLNPEEVLQIPSSTDPLIQACLLLGTLTGLSIQVPEDLDPTLDVSAQLGAICEASSLRCRQVKLSKNWHKEDCGPLLAFYGEEQKPVVLRQRGRGYEKIDPYTHTKEAVLAKNAPQFLKLAYMFYRPFPATLSTAKEMLRFYLQTHGKELFPIILYGALGSLISLFAPFATATIFARAIPDANPTLVVQLCLGLLLTAISTGAFFYLRTLGLVRMTGFASSTLQAALWDRLLKLPVSFFRKFTTGNLVQRVLSIEEIRSIVSDNSTRIILAGLFSFFYLIAMLFYSPLLSLLSLLLMGLGLAVTVLCFYFKLRLMRHVQDLTQTINGVLVQIISGVSKLRVAGAENNAFSYWAKLFTKLKRYELSAQSVHNVVLVLVAALPMLSYAVIFGAVMNLKETGALSIGAFLGFNAAFITFSAALIDVCSALMEMVAIPPLWENARTILSAEQEVIEERAKSIPLSGEISIDAVSFTYEPGGPLILDEISIAVVPKEFVAIVGPSGSGKSTLVRLLLGFEQPNRGTIYYDGQELPSLNLHHVRRQIGIVMQTGGIIAGTIHDNLVCGGIYPKEKIEASLALSGFAKDMHTLPMGLHTFLPMGGETLSGGQKQRLLIARALLPEPKILIFDEATSALDNKVQDEISRNLDALDVTRIVIAHRLSTIRHADRIYVMEQGKVVQTGTFEELSQTSGIFAKMLKRQQL